MTDIDQTLPVAPGDMIHAARGGVTISVGNGFGHVTTPGESICVTAAMIAASFDNFGQSWMSLIGDDDAQVERWGAVSFRLGRAPEGVQTWNARGDSDWVEQREAARREAWAQPTVEARNAAMAAMHARFGPAPTTAVYTKIVDPSVRLAEEQRAALDAGGIRMKSHYSAQEPGVIGERR